MQYEYLQATTVQCETFEATTVQYEEKHKLLAVLLKVLAGTVLQVLGMGREGRRRSEYFD